MTCCCQELQGQMFSWSWELIKLYGWNLEIGKWWGQRTCKDDFYIFDVNNLINGDSMSWGGELRGEADLERVWSSVHVGAYWVWGRGCVLGKQGVWWLAWVLVQVRVYKLLPKPDNGIAFQFLDKWLSFIIIPLWSLIQYSTQNISVNLVGRTLTVFIM